MSAYAICNLLIKFGRTDGLQAKINMFYACGQVTDDEYAKLTNTLTPKTDSGATTGSGTGSTDDTAADSKTTTTDAAASK